MINVLNAPVAQWIEHWSPEPSAGVRFPPGAPFFYVSDRYSTVWQGF